MTSYVEFYILFVVRALTSNDNLPEAGHGNMQVENAFLVDIIL